MRGSLVELAADSVALVSMIISTSLSPSASVGPAPLTPAPPEGNGSSWLDSTHSTSVAFKIVSLCHFSAYVKSRIAPQNRQLVPAERLCKLSDCASESLIRATYARFRRHAVEDQLGGSNVMKRQVSHTAMPCQPEQRTRHALSLTQIDDSQGAIRDLT